MYFWKVYFPKAYQLSESVFSKGVFSIFLFYIFSEIVFSENLFSERIFFKRVFFTKLICISPIPKMHFSDLVRWRGVHYNALGPWVNICSFELLATCFMLIWCKNIYIYAHYTHIPLTQHSSPAGRIIVTSFWTINGAVALVTLHKNEMAMMTEQQFRF